MSASVYMVSFDALGKDWTDSPSQMKASLKLGSEQGVGQAENIM